MIATLFSIPLLKAVEKRELEKSKNFIGVILIACITAYIGYIGLSIGLIIGYGVNIGLRSK